MAWATVDQLRDYLDQVADLGAQRITITNATGGTFVLSYEGASTGALAYNATATAVQTALRGITAIGSAGVNVSGRPGDYLVRFLGALSTDAGPITANGALLTGTTPTISVESATEDLLTACLDRATDTVRQAMRATLADPLFDYAAYGAAATRIVRGYDSPYLRLPPFQAASVSLVEYESGTSPLTYTTIAADQWTVEGTSIYRPAGWGPTRSRYRITAVWGSGPTVPSSIEEVTLEIAVNIWRSRDTGGFVETTGADGAASTRLVAGLTKLQQTTIANVCSQIIDIGV